MTARQRSYFFGTLWPQACRVQGWVGETAREVKRREIVLAATTKLHAEVPRMKKPTDSMSACDQDQLTAVFNHVKHLADPLNLQKAIAAENPGQAAALDECNRLLFKIREGMKRGDYNYAYVQKIADWNCRSEQVADWQTLPAEALRTVLIHLNDRANAKDPDVEPRGPRRKAPRDERTVYQMRPARKFVPKEKPQPVLATVSDFRHGEDDNIPY